MTEEKFVASDQDNAAKTSASIYTNKLIIFFGKRAFFTLLFSTKMSSNPTNIAVKPLARGSWFHLSIEIDVISTVDKSTDQGKWLSIY